MYVLNKYMYIILYDCKEWKGGEGREGERERGREKEGEREREGEKRRERGKEREGVSLPG